MAHELVASVAISPHGTVRIGLGHSITFTGTYALNGANPGGPTTSSYSMHFEKDTPAPPASVGLPESNPVAGTGYSRSYTPPDLGEYTLQVRVNYLSNAASPYNSIDTYSDTLTVIVETFHEGEKSVDSWTEGQNTATSWTEGQNTSTSWTEGQNTATGWTEGQNTSTSWTEGTHTP